MEVETEPMNEQPSGNAESTSVVSSSSDTPKTNEKKVGARLSSDAPSPLGANKIAKMSPRSTRSSQNPDFAAKQRKFLNRVHDPTRRDYSDSENSQGSTTPSTPKQSKEGKPKSVERKSGNDLKRKFEKDSTHKKSVDSEEDGSTKKKRTKEPTKVVGGVDSYCWRCHRDGNVIKCEICPRVYHLKCVQIEAAPPKGWMCPECSMVMQAENTDTRSRAMRMLTLDQLCNLLRFALNRMKNHEGAEDFAKPVDLAAFPHYKDFIVKPMDLSQLKRNIKARMYGSTEAFHADAKWIVHNSIIFNSVQSKFTNTARALMKICRQEMQEIENCPDCYQNAHTRSTDSWFIEACRRPHLLVWAKLKGFPFWPAKAMTTNSENLVDVRFFGAHDRAWVPLSSCYLFSKVSPAPPSNKNKRNLEECLYELESHIKKLRDKFGQFEYPPYKTPYDPRNEAGQMAMFLPKYEAKTPGKRTMRISLHQDGARKSLMQRKNVTEKSASESNKSSTPVKDTPQPVNKDTPPSSQASPIKVITTEVSPTKSPPMVSFPGKLNSLTGTGSPAKSGSRASSQRKDAQLAEAFEKLKSLEQAVGKHGTSMGVKKSYKAPLTAAAKKCFATKDKSCAKCHCETSDSWHQALDGQLVCTKCHSTEDQPVEKPQVELKKDGQSSEQNTTMRGTVTVEQQSQTEDMEEPPETPAGDVVTTAVVESVSTEIISEPMADKDTESAPERAAGDGGDTQEGEADVPPIPSASGDTSTVDLVAVDSPPKFIIPKTSGSSTPESSKKVSIVDRLQEKLCFAVEEAIKSHVPTVESEKNLESVVDEAEKVVEETTTDCEKEESNDKDGSTPLKEGKKVMQLLLHDLKNDKNLMEKIDSPSINTKETEIELQTTSESGSEPDTDRPSSAGSDCFSINIESNKRKKQNNINNVVKTLKERKSSVEDKTEQTSKSTHQDKDSRTLLLDDSNDGSTVLIIDEDEYSTVENKKSPGKMDKNRRKGIPAKVYSRSSTSSTESSEISSPEEQTSKPKPVVEVLDEVSGQFRRPSSESNLTITVVTDDSAPQKRPPKEIRSVNISKSLSLSVINDSSASLDMECVESDIDDQMMVDSGSKHVTIQAKARKTLPNSPKQSELPILQERSSPSVHRMQNELKIVNIRQNLNIDPTTPPPPLINLRQPTALPGPSRALSNSEAPGPRPSTSRASNTSSARGYTGQTNTLIDEAVRKMSTNIRSVLEETVREITDGGSAEATIKALQTEMEKLQWRHRQEMKELRHNADLIVMEIRASVEGEKQRALLDAKHKHEVDKEQTVLETKRKQWCAHCQKEAQLYCCWNTAYCSYTCQQSHWAVHMPSCLNKQQLSAPEMVHSRSSGPRPPYHTPSGQMPQQMMPPPANPIPYHQAYRPNQVYTAAPLPNCTVTRPNNTATRPNTTPTRPNNGTAVRQNTPRPPYPATRPIHPPVYPGEYYPRAPQ